jgi:hypothetical protein
MGHARPTRDITPFAPAGKRCSLPKELPTGPKVSFFKAAWVPTAGAHFRSTQ